MRTAVTIVTRGATAMLLAAALSFPLAPQRGEARGAGDTLPATSGPNLVVNGGFERGADPQSQLILAAGTTFLTGWTVVNPGCCGVYYMGTAWQAQEGTRSLMLTNPAPGNLKYAGGVTQTFPTTAGFKYLLTFSQAGNPSYPQPMTIQAQAAGRTSTYTYQATAGTTTQHMAWVRRAVTFTAKAASTTVAFYAYQTCCNVGLGLDNVQVHALAATGTPAPSGTAGTSIITGTVTLRLAAPSLAAGSPQTVQGTAGNNASVALVVDYPDGTQLLAPLKASADGHYTYKWTVPTSIHGSVRVLVDSAGKTAKSSFVVS